MSLPKYPQYKDSGVAWLGEVPEHWETLALKRIVTLRSGETITANSIDEHGLYQVFGGNGVRGYTENYTHDGDFALIGRQGALCGNINYASGKFWASEHAIVVTPITKIITHWIGSLLYAMNLNQYSTSAAQPGLSVEMLENLQVPFIDKIEQAAIANFLGQETGKIDALVAEQEKLITLLKEKRQALISHAVTKGLNPDVPMKNSGVEWLGEVPEHWSVIRVRWLCEIRKRIVGELGFNVLSITQKGIKIKDTESNEGQLSMDYSKYQLVEVGDFAMNHMDLLTGYVDVSNVVGVTSPDYRVFSIRDRKVSNEKYLLYLFQNGYTNKIFFPFGQGSSHFGRWRLPTNQFNDFKFPLPKIEEQTAIANFLDQETTKIDALVTEAQSAIALLQERRSALISAAVTGKIDVRGIQTQETV